FVTLVAASCQQTQQQADAPEADPNAITCEGIGPVKLSYTYADLDSALGANKLENGMVEENGQSIQITRVFPNEAEEITVYWAESEEPFNTITKIAVENNFGPYQTAEGLRVGSTLGEV